MFFTHKITLTCPKMTAAIESATEKVNNNQAPASPTNSEVRRNRPGTKSADYCQWPEENFEEMDSTLAVQQFIQQSIRKDVTDVDTILTAPETQDEGVWKYEHLRQFCMELNGLAVALQNDCQPENCSQMTATEQWIFLCAAHKTPKECPAIDYTRHTLDGAACLLNSNKYFPSRVSIKVITRNYKTSYFPKAKKYFRAKQKELYFVRLFLIFDPSFSSLSLKRVGHFFSSRSYRGQNHSSNYVYCKNDKGLFEALF